MVTTMKTSSYAPDGRSWETLAVSVEDAVGRVPRGARVFVHGAAATPTPLLAGLVARPDLDGVTLYHLHTSGPAPFAAPEVAGRFRSVSALAPICHPTEVSAIISASRELSRRLCRSLRSISSARVKCT